MNKNSSIKSQVLFLRTSDYPLLHPYLFIPSVFLFGFIHTRLFHPLSLLSFILRPSLRSSRLFSPSFLLFIPRFLRMLFFSACLFLPFSPLIYYLPSLIPFPNTFHCFSPRVYSLPPSLPVYTHPFVFSSYLLSSLINSLHFLSFIQFILSLLPPGFSLPSFIPFPNLFPHSSLFPPPHIFLAPPIYPLPSSTPQVPLSSFILSLPVSLLTFIPLIYSFLSFIVFFFPSRPLVCPLPLFYSLHSLPSFIPLARGLLSLRAVLNLL